MFALLCALLPYLLIFIYVELKHDSTDLPLWSEVCLDGLVVQHLTCTASCELMRRSLVRFRVEAVIFASLEPTGKHPQGSGNHHSKTATVVLACGGHNSPSRPSTCHLVAVDVQMLAMRTFRVALSKSLR